MTPKTLLASTFGEKGFSRAKEALLCGKCSLDAIQEGLRVVEADAGVRYVCRGGDPNILGELEFDASLMDGRTLRAGAVAAVRDTVSPVSVARLVMERLPYVLLCGEGATRFAREMGLHERTRPNDEAAERYEAWCRERSLSAGSIPPDLPLTQYYSGHNAPHDTAIYLAIDGHEDIAAGASTSGACYKYPGRVGDSAQIGGGIYAHNRHGACACTHTGEMSMRAATSAAVVQYMKRGAAAREACLEAANDLRELQGGRLGTLLIHAVSRSGETFALMAGPPDPEACYWTWQEGGEIRRLVPEAFGL